MKDATPSYQVFTLPNKERFEPLENCKNFEKMKSLAAGVIVCVESLDFGVKLFNPVRNQRNW